MTKDKEPGRIGRPSGSHKTEQEEGTTLYLPVSLKRRAEAQALHESKDGQRRYLRNIIIDALAAYLDEKESANGKSGNSNH